MDFPDQFSVGKPHEILKGHREELLRVHQGELGGFAVVAILDLRKNAGLPQPIRGLLQVVLGYAASNL